MSLSIIFTNDKTGDVATGNYDVEVRANERLVWRGRIEGHARYEGWEGLVRHLFMQVVPQRTILDKESKDVHKQDTAEHV